MSEAVPDLDVRFAVPFSWESPVGRLVDLLDSHVARGLVIQFDAGSAPAAERLRQRGFEFAAVAGRAEDVDRLADRGFAAVHLDATVASAGEVRRALRELMDGAAVPLRAVLLDGVLDRAADPDGILAVLASELSSLDDVVVGATVANVAHETVAVALLNGTFAPHGPGPHHHTRALFVERMGAAGFVERYSSDLEGSSDSSAISYDPARSPGAQLGSYLHRLRSAADGDAASTHFAALFTIEVGPAERQAPHDGTATLAVLVPADLPAPVRDLLDDQLASQVSTDFEVVERERGDSTGLAGLTQPYTVVIQGGETLAPNWTSEFLETIKIYPGAIVRTASLSGSWPAFDSFFGLLHGQNAPDAAFAFPTHLLYDSGNVRIRANGRLDLFPVLLSGATRCGVVDTGVATLDVRAGWHRGDDAAAARALLDAAPFLVPAGSAQLLADVIEMSRVDPCVSNPPPHRHRSMKDSARGAAMAGLRGGRSLVTWLRTRVGRTRGG